MDRHEIENEQQFEFERLELVLTDNPHQLERSHLASYTAGFLAALSFIDHDSQTNAPSKPTAGAPFAAHGRTDSSSPQFVRSSSSPVKDSSGQLLSSTCHEHLAAMAHAVRWKGSVETKDTPEVGVGFKAVHPWVDLAKNLHAEEKRCVTCDVRKVRSDDMLCSSCQENQSFCPTCADAEADRVEMKVLRRRVEHLREAYKFSMGRVARSETEAREARAALLRLCQTMRASERKMGWELDAAELLCANLSYLEEIGHSDEDSEMEEEDAFLQSPSDSELDEEGHEPRSDLEDAWNLEVVTTEDEGLEPTEIEDNEDDEDDSNQIPFYYDNKAAPAKAPSRPNLSKPAGLAPALDKTTLHADDIQPRRLFEAILPPGAHAAERHSPISRLPLIPRANPSGLVDPFTASNPFASAKAANAARPMSSSPEVEQISTSAWLRKRKSDVLDAAASAAEEDQRSESEGEGPVQSRRVVRELEVDDQVNRKGKGRELGEGKSKTRPPTRAVRRKSAIGAIRASRSQSSTHSEED